MRKQIVIIETEWDKRRARKEREELNKSRPSKKERKAIQQRVKGKNAFINKVAAKLRKHTPKSETWFKSILEANHLESLFLSNIPLNDVIPDYINLEHKIVIEVDGSVHWNNKVQLAKDAKKDELYKSMGYTIYRVNHHDTNQANKIIKDIQNKVTPISREMRGDNGPSLT